MSQQQALEVSVISVHQEAERIRSYELRMQSGGPLPSFTPGAHIDLYLSEHLIRSYSLVNTYSSTQDRYVIAVHQSPQSRGGSRWIFERVAKGDVLRISQPKNHFPLNEAASHSVLIAGGIGITPLLSMARHLQSHGKSWELHYCTRNMRRAAFVKELTSPKMTGKVSLYYSDIHGEQDIESIVRKASSGTHFYCCGPKGMLDSFQAATKNIDPERAHIERFCGLESAKEGGFNLHLARSKKTLRVQQGETILDRLHREGFQVPNSCREGVCGSCEVRVLEGRVDHRDLILTDDEKAANTTMFVCCSGSITPSLTLDL